MKCSFISWLNHWQTLIGAIIGGLMGFIGAWWVARTTIARSEKTAAQNIMATLLCIKTRAEAVDNSLNNIDEKYRKLEFVLRYLSREPLAPPSLYSDMTIVMPCCYQLAVAISGLRILWLNVDSSIQSVKNKINIYEKTEEKIQITPYLDAHICTIYEGVHEISSQVNDIINLLENNVISRLRVVNNFILWVKRNI